MGVATREAYGQALAELGKTNPNVVVLDADLAKSTYSAKFEKQFPERFFTCGIAEANMVGIASGLALSGKIPFASSFAVFLCDKGYDQWRMCVAYPHVNAKFCGSHGGISIGEDGPSQMAIEDYALMCALPGFTVLVPSDEFSGRALVKAAAEHGLEGGLGSLVAKAVALSTPVPMEFVGIQNTFAESGAPDQLMEKYGLTASNVVSAVKRVLKRK